jgi:hypothetical protein
MIVYSLLVHNEPSSIFALYSYFWRLMFFWERDAWMVGVVAAWFCWHWSYRFHFRIWTNHHSEWILFFTVPVSLYVIIGMIRKTALQKNHKRSETGHCFCPSASAPSYHNLGIAETCHILQFQTSSTGTLMPCAPRWPMQRKMGKTWW